MYYFEVLKKYAAFSGRASRKEYWMFFLENFIAAFLLGIIAGILQVKILGTLYLLFILIPSLALTVRRLHDIGKSGWWLLIFLIPLLSAIISSLLSVAILQLSSILSIIIFVVFGIWGGQSGENQYGPDPKVIV